jgi:glycosyltransferase involved in cell wall biosynthesis
LTPVFSKNYLMRIILCVTNDIATDRRVHRIAMSLLNMPASVLVIGRIFPDSMELPVFSYQTYRIKMIFRKKLLFYAEYNVRLFFRLLFEKADMLVANDLDTLPAVFLASKIRRLPVVYDSHEYFTEVPELVGRKWVKKIWEKLEAAMLPRIQFATTVSASIAGEYRRKYGISMRVVRNLPFRMENIQPQVPLKKDGEHIIIYQGSLNTGRGLEMAIRAMHFMENTLLVIAGTGDVENTLRELAGSLSVEKKIRFTGRIPPEELRNYTVQADLGISLEEKLGLNYYYALPNKLFDYIQARIPVLVSDLPEMAQVVTQYGIGSVNHAHDPFELAMNFQEMLHNKTKRQVWLSNLEKAAMELCWENEEMVLIGLYKQAMELLPHK